MQTIQFDPTIRGINLPFYFSNQVLVPGLNTFTDAIYYSLATNPLFDSFIADGTFVVSQTLPDSPAYFSSPFTGILESDIDPGQVIQTLWI